MSARNKLMALVLGLACASPAAALDILLTNDDGYDHPNIRALYRHLVEAGHNVHVAAPWKEQSGRGGAFLFGRETTAGQDDDPAYPNSHYLKTTDRQQCVSPACAGSLVELDISATPVMSVLYGLKKVLPNPDLVISGPNVGNNIGYINHYSGTYNAAVAALNSGVPSIAVSAFYLETDSETVAQLTTGLVRALEQSRQPGQPLLPAGIGLNVNIPPLPDIKGWRITRVGTYVPYDTLYTEDLGPTNPKLAGKPGIGFVLGGKPGVGEENSEGTWVSQGHVTISPFRVGADSPTAAELGWPALDALPDLARQQLQAE